MARSHLGTNGSAHSSANSSKSRNSRRTRTSESSPSSSSSSDDYKSMLRSTLSGNLAVESLEYLLDDDGNGNSNGNGNGNGNGGGNNGGNIHDNIIGSQREDALSLSSSHNKDNLNLVVRPTDSSSTASNSSASSSSTSSSASSTTSSDSAGDSVNKDVEDHSQVHANDRPRCPPPTPLRRWNDRNEEEATEEDASSPAYTARPASTSGSTSRTTSRSTSKVGKGNHGSHSHLSTTSPSFKVSPQTPSSSSPLMKEWKSRFQRATQQRHELHQRIESMQQQQRKTTGSSCSPDKMTSTPWKKKASTPTGHFPAGLIDDQKEPTVPVSIFRKSSEYPKSVRFSSTIVSDISPLPVQVEPGRTTPEATTFPTPREMMTSPTGVASPTIARGGRSIASTSSSNDSTSPPVTPTPVAASTPHRRRRRLLLETPPLEQEEQAQKEQEKLPSKQTETALYTPNHYLLWASYAGPTTQLSSPLSSSFNLAVANNDADDSNNSSSLLLSPEKWQDIQQRNTLLEIAWQDQQAEAWSLERQLEELEERHSPSQKGLAEEITTTVTREQQLEMQWKQACIQIQELEDKLQQLQQQKHTDAPTQENGNRDYSSLLEELQERLHARQQQNDEMSLELNKALRKINSLQHLQQQTALQLSQAQHKNDRMESELDDARDQMDGLQNRLEQTQQTNDELKIIQVELTSKLEQALQQNEILVHQMKVAPPPPNEDDDATCCNRNAIIHELEQRQQELRRTLDQVAQEKEELDQLQQETAIEFERTVELNCHLQDALQVQAHQLQDLQDRYEMLEWRQFERGLSSAFTDANTRNQHGFGDDVIVVQNSQLSSSHQDESSPSMASMSSGVSLHVAKLQRHHAAELEEMERQMHNATLLLHTNNNNSVTSSSVDVTTPANTISVVSPTRFDTCGHLPLLGALSPILPDASQSLNHRVHGGDKSEDQDEDDEMGTLGSAPSTPRIDDLIDELGEMDHERTTLLDYISRNQPTESASPEDADEVLNERGSFSRHRNSREPRNEESMLDATLDLIYKMKDLIMSPPPPSSSSPATEVVLDEKETSVLEQMEILSELMGYNSRSDSVSSSSDDEKEASLPLLPSNVDEVNNNEDPSSLMVGDTSNICDGGHKNDDEVLLCRQESIHPHSYKVVVNQPSAGSETSGVVWSDLVTELKRHVSFLELDRAEVVRTTQAYLDKERHLMVLQIEAAAATARREGYEQGRATARQHFTKEGLCNDCQERILSW